MMAPVWLILTVVALALLAIAAARYAAPRGREYDADYLIGERGTARTRLDPAGRVFADGAIWRAVTVDGAPVEAGDPVVIVGRERLTLRVRRADPEQPLPAYKRRIEV